MVSKYHTRYFTVYYYELALEAKNRERRRRSLELHRMYSARGEGEEGGADGDTAATSGPASAATAAQRRRAPSPR